MIVDVNPLQVAVAVIKIPVANKLFESGAILLPLFFVHATLSFLRKQESLDPD